MHSVWKFIIPTEDVFTISVPQGARILSVAAQGDCPFIWAEVDPRKPKEDRRFRMCGTGHPIPEHESRKFVGTFFLRGESLVFHVFELAQSGEGKSDV